MSLNFLKLELKCHELTFNYVFYIGQNNKRLKINAESCLFFQHRCFPIENVHHKPPLL